MKIQTFNKYFIGITFLFVLFIFPSYIANAKMLALDDDSGGGGGGTPPPAYVPPPVTYGSVSLDVSIGSGSPYTGSNFVTASAGAIVNTCSNTTSGLTVTAQILDSSGNLILGQSEVGIINTNIQGGTNTGTLSGTLTAPTTAGSYILRFYARRYDPAGLAMLDRYNEFLVLGTGDYYKSDGTRIYFNINNYGRIIDAENDAIGGNVSYVLNELYNSGSYIIGEKSRTLISTTTSDITFTVGAVGAVTVYANGQNPLTVPYNQNVNISWTSGLYTKKCTCTYLTAGDCTPTGTTIGSNISAKGNPYPFKATKTITVKCDNLP